MIGLGLIFLLMYGIPNRYVRVRKSFESHRQSYVDLLKRADGERAATPYIRGKLITFGNIDCLLTPVSPAIGPLDAIPSDEKYVAFNEFDVLPWNSDDVYWKIPSRMRAKNPEEAETIVSIEWKYEILSYYRDETALRNLHRVLKIVCTMSIIDKTEARIVDKKYFEGESLPLPEKKFDSDFIGKKPVEEMAQYMNSLPQK